MKTPQWKCSVGMTSGVSKSNDCWGKKWRGRGERRNGRSGGRWEVQQASDCNEHLADSCSPLNHKARLLPPACIHTLPLLHQLFFFLLVCLFCLFVCSPNTQTMMLTSVMAAPHTALRCLQPCWTTPCALAGARTGTPWSWTATSTTVSLPAPPHLHRRPCYLCR